MSKQSIPVVKLSDYTLGDAESQARFVESLGEGLREFGFVAIEEHGISGELIDRNYNNFMQLFELPEDKKRKYERAADGRQRGYTSFGVEHAKGHEKADLKEFWHVGRELPEGHSLIGRMSPNEWPAEVPELKEDALAYYDAMDEVAQVILTAFSVYLGQGPDVLPSMVRDGNSVMRIIHYPICDGFDQPGVMRAAAHEDINMITLLPQATQSGLQIKTRDGEWLELESVPGQLVVDTGDMMKRITNDEIPATTHRVVNPQGVATARYSMPFFVHPHPERVLSVLPGMLAKGETPKYAEFTADQYLKERLAENRVK